MFEIVDKFSLEFEPYNFFGDYDFSAKTDGLIIAFLVALTDLFMWVSPDYDVPANDAV